MPRSKLIPPAIGLVAGAIAATLTILAPAGPFYCITFGIIISLFLWFISPVSSLQRVLGFNVVSVAAYFAAQFAAIYTAAYVPQQIPNNGPLPADLPLMAFFLGGVTGAFLVVFAALLFFSAEIDLLEIFFKSFLWSLLGGTLGVIGWAGGPTVGKFLLDVVSQYQFEKYVLVKESGSFFSLLLIWQTGMGAAIGIMFRQEKLRSIFSNNKATLATRAPASTWIVRYCLIAASLLLTVYMMWALRPFR